MDAASKYRFVERADGFIVEGSQRVPVRVQLRDTGFRVQLHLPKQLSLFPELDAAASLRAAKDLPDANLVQYRKLVELVAAGVMSRWKPTHLRAPPWRIEPWAQEQTRRGLKCRIYEQWQRLTAKANPHIFGVQKAVFAASLRDTDLLHEMELYEDSYLVRDIQKYRAAAAIVPIAQELVASHMEQADFAAAGTSGCDDEEQVVDRVNCGDAVWDDEEYCSVDSVLMQLPGGVPCGLLYELHHMRLVRPMTSRIELACLLLSSSEAYEDVRRDRRHRRHFHHATQTQIRDGMARVSAEIRNRLSHRLTRDIGRFVRYLLDYPDEHSGNFQGLVRAAIQWHRTHVRDEEEWFSKRYDDAKPTMLPSIPLPQLSGIRFLGTVGEVRAEGKQMQHCVGSYADQAVSGDCFLFHVEFEGDCATVEISKSGRVRQSCGPNNQTNKATAYAERVLRHWGSLLAGPKPCRVRPASAPESMGRGA